MKDASAALLHTSRSFASGILCSKLTKRDSWVAYFAVFVSSVVYSLPITHLSKTTLRKIQSLATHTCLMKTGFNSNTAHRVVFGPSLHGGLGFRDQFVEQGVSQVLLLLRHLRADSPQGNVFRITIDSWQLVMGVSYPLLEHPDPILPHQDPHWLSVLRQFLQNLNASIHIPGIMEKLPSPLREADANLMDAVRALPSLSRPQLLACNRCRIFYGVTYLSEVSTADGTAISRDAWDDTRQRCSLLLWPYQPTPGPKSFRLWRRLLATVFLQDHRSRVSVRTRNLIIRRKLRRWRPDSQAFRYQWTAFYSTSSNSLFVLHDNGDTFNTHPVKKHRRRRKHPIRAFAIDHTDTTRTLPPDAVPVDSWAEPNKSSSQR
jgi:hypothetical protein